MSAVPDNTTSDSNEDSEHKHKNNNNNKESKENDKTCLGRIRLFFVLVFREAFVASLLAQALAKLGRFNTRHPYLVIAVGITVAVGLAFGLFTAEVESRPVELWVPSRIRSNEERKYYDSTFSPFFRINQVITTSITEGDNALTKPILHEMIQLERDTYDITVVHDGKNYTIEDLCYRPAIFEPCVVQTVLDYWYDKALKIHSDAKVDADADLFATVSHAVKTPLGNPIMRDNVISPSNLVSCQRTCYAILRNYDQLPRIGKELGLIC